MATFPDYQPTYSASKKSQPQVRVTKFGDGYEQRISMGLNIDPKEWSLTFDVTDEDADVIEAFLEARANDAENFSWTPPATETAYKWVCPNWDRELYEFQRSRINVTFRQVFEP